MQPLKTWMRTSLSNGHTIYFELLKPSNNTPIIYTHTSIPIKSANFKGPIGCPIPNFIIESIDSLVATPSIKVYIASLIIGINILLDIKPLDRSLLKKNSEDDYILYFALWMR